MSEPEKKDGFSVIDAIEGETKKKGTPLFYLWVFLILSFGVFSVFKWGIGNSGNEKGATQDNNPKNDLDQEGQYAAVKDFAEKFTIMAFNVSYTDINHQVDKVGNLMSDNMMSFYQEAFLDPKWVA